MSKFCNVSVKTKKYTNKDGRSLSNLGIHLLREHKEEYNLADGTHKKNNEILINMNSKTLKQSLDKFIDDNDLKIRNSRTVLAYQVVFSIPKEIKNEPEKIEKFKSQTLKMLNENEIFKGNVLLAVYHGDEIQPHIQAVVVPKKGNKLAFQELLGGYPEGSNKLHKLQDDFGEAMKPLGLIRGDGTHTNGRDYKQYKKDIENLHKPLPKLPAIPQVEETKNPLKIFNKLEQLENQNIALQKQNKILKNEFNKSSFYENQNKQLKEVNLVLKNKKNNLENEKMKLSNEQMEKLRAIDCKEVMESLGYTHMKTDKSKYKSESLNLVISKENKFYENNSGVGGGGAIDLLTKVFKYSFLDARNYLAEKFGFERTAKVISSDPDKAQTLIETSLKKSLLELPKPKPNNIENIKKYLIEKRKLDKAIVEELIQKNKLYADGRNNCVFTNDKNDFAFIRGTYEVEGKKPFAGCVGKIDFIKYDFNQSKTNEIYLFESSIDALSFRTLNPNKNGVYVVLNGNALIDRVQELGIDSFDKVHLCFDNDEQGIKFCDKIKKQTTSTYEVHKPNFKDFNEDLKNGYITEQLAKTIARRDQQNSATIDRETKTTQPDSTERNNPSRRRFPR